MVSVVDELLTNVVHHARTRYLRLNAEVARDFEVAGDHRPADLGSDPRTTKLYFPRLQH